MAGFRDVIQDTYDQKSIDKYDKICKEATQIKEKIDAIAKVDTTSVQTKKIISELNEYEKQYSILVQKKKTVSQESKPEIEKQMKNIDSKITSIITETPILKTAVASSKSIESNVESINAINKTLDNGKKDNKSPIQWFKEGYFLQFGEFIFYPHFFRPQLVVS